MGTKFNVDSSNLKFLRYNESDSTLDVWFKNSENMFYRYADVDFITYSELITADSKGKYFFSNIKSKFEFTKMEE